MAVVSDCNLLSPVGWLIPMHIMSKAIHVHQDLNACKYNSNYPMNRAGFAMKKPLKCRQDQTTDREPKHGRNWPIEQINLRTMFSESISAICEFLSPIWCNLSPIDSHKLPCETERTWYDSELLRSWLLKIFDAEVMIYGEGFTQWSGTAEVETQYLY